jgi:deoxyribonuclease V
MSDLFPSDHSRNSLLSAQKLAAERAVIRDDFAPIKLIAGADQAFAGDMMLSGIVVLNYPSLEIVERVFSIEQVIFPYIPTFLSFREGPAIMSAFEKLKNRPDILMVDGAGINHPRRAGIATHIGVALDVPTIGITKKLLCGSGEEPVEVGEASPLLYEARKVGWLLKSIKRCRAIIVAPGHRVSLESSLSIVRSCLRGHKLPEPARLAHLYANEEKKRFLIS